jgi:hypothetical protein
MSYEPLTKAAHLAQLDYQRVRSAAIRGEVAARQISGGRWVVNLDDVFRLKSKMIERDGLPG